MTDDVDAQARNFAQAVGLTLHNWSMVEIQLGRLFAVLSDMPDDSKAHAIIDAVVSFDVRRSLVDTMVACEPLDDVTHQMWQVVSDGLRKAYKRRHTIAHFSMMAHTTTGGKEEIRFHPFLSSHQIKTRTQKHLPISHIHEFSEKIRNEIMPAIDWFLGEACSRRGLPVERGDREPEAMARIRKMATDRLARRR